MKQIKIILLLALAILLKFSAQAQVTKRQLLQLDSTLTRLHEQGMFNGVILLADQGKVSYKKAFGEANIVTHELLNPNSAFNLASVSKQFIAMMAMVLQERGKLKYEDKVQQHLPDFPYPDITIRQLLTHTSGLPEYFDLVLEYRNTLDTLNNNSLLQLLSEFKPTLKFQPGSRWEYCNTGYVMLASVVEKAAAMPIERFFKQSITEPLGLKDTYIYTLNSSTSPASRVFGFQRENGVNVPNDLMRFDGVVGDGNIYASAEDLLRWDQALYTEKLVKKQTIQEAFSPVKLNDGTHYPYGFGWFIEADGKILRHTGSWVGFLNEIIRDTEKKQTLILLSNGSDGRARACVKAILADKKAELPKLQLIQNVRLIDGSGTPARACAVRIRDKQIWEIGELKPLPGETVFDAGGLSLAPGFIDSHSHHFSGLKKHPDGLALSSQGISTIVIGQDGVSYPMDTLQAYFSKNKVAINVATYAGHTSLREWTMGENDMLRLSTAEELDSMKSLLKTEMQKGALGLSTGLEYEHAFFSNRNEVIELAKVTAAAGGRYISHIRSEDVRLEEAIAEIIEIGRQAKLPVQISHIKMAKRDQWGKAPQLLAELENARAAGIDITADCYPYDFWNSTLRVLFPNRDYTNPESAELAVTQLCDPDKSIVVAFEPNPEYAGKSISGIAALRKETASKTLMYLIAAADEFDQKHPNFQGNTEGVMGKSMDKRDIEKFLSWPHTNICSDGNWDGGHPRGHGAFTRVLGRYVRDQKIMPLEMAIYKMTGLTAQHLGFTDRGLVASGYFADLVLFDPEKVQDHADISNPHALSSGIEKVWVNGALILDKQKPSGALSGVLIKRETKH